MAALAELLETVASGITGAGDYRADKTALFGAAAEALPSFLPLASDGSASNPIQVLDFFSGAGGASLGFAAINSVVPAFRFLAGCDVDPASAATYGKNFGTPTVCENILKIADTPASVRAFLGKVGFDRRKPTILIGCAPCQGFSSHRKKHWGATDDDRNGLVIAFSRIVAEVGPSAFIMENVPEFLSSRYWSYFSGARKVFGEAGYIVKQNIYNAAEFGVPQERFRCIVIGMKKKFLLPEGHLVPEKYRTVREAIGGLPPLRAGEGDPTDPLHRAVAHKKSTIDVIK
jgi:DNA (cytosine-5)-methyltransferase 1